jgi:hypothetical protein
VLVRLAKIAPVYLAVAEARAVIFSGFLVGTLALVALVALVAVLPSLLEAFVEARVQRRLTKLERATIVAVTITVAAAALVTVVVAVRVSVAIVATEIAPAITVRVVTILECFAKVSAVQLAVAQARVVVLSGSSVDIRVSIVGLSAVLPIVVGRAHTFVEAGVQSGLAQLHRAAIIPVTIPVAILAILIPVAVLRVAGCARTNADAKQ